MPRCHPAVALYQRIELNYESSHLTSDLSIFYLKLSLFTSRDEFPVSLDVNGLALVCYPPSLASSLSGLSLVGPVALEWLNVATVTVTSLLFVSVELCLCSVMLSLSGRVRMSCCLWARSSDKIRHSLAKVWQHQLKDADELSCSLIHGAGICQSLL